jgi:acetylornithine deacetylase/succinyl-diaminopimelate desuccinylase-like protein
VNRASPASGRADIDGRVLAAVDDGETLSLLARLIETPSCNPPGDEAAAAAVLGEFLAPAGITPATHEVSPGRPNLEAALGPGSLAQAHRPNEYVEVRQVQQATRAFALTIVGLLC